MFPICYVGNKYNESKKHLDIDYSKFKYIIEPFGGSFGFTRAIYKRCSNDCKFIINDIDSDLIKLYKYLRDGDTNKLCKDATKKLKVIIKKMGADTRVMAHIKKLDSESIENIYLKIAARHSFYVRFSEKILPKLEILANFKNSELHKLFERCIFTNLDADDFIAKYQSKKKALFYFDPPYFNSDNASYNLKKTDKDNVCIDHTSVFVNIYKIAPKVDFIFVTNKIHLFDLLFSDYAQLEYPKQYSKTKRKCTHIVYSNLPLGIA